MRSARSLKHVSRRHVVLQTKKLHAKRISNYANNMSTRKALRLGRLVQIGAGAGVVFVLGQFAWGSERFYDALVC